MARRKRTWQDNAAEFAALDQGEGWPFARLVACSVQKPPDGVRRGSDSDWNQNGKVNGTEFAKVAGCGPARILRYLKAWDDAAAKGLATPSAALTPADVRTIAEPDAEWKDYYSTAVEDRPKRYADKAMSDPEMRRKVLEDMAPADRQQLAKEIIKSDPDVADAIVADSDAHVEIIRASSRRAEADNPRTQQRREIAEPFARILTDLRLEAMWRDAQALRDIVLQDFTGSYVWRPNELEAVLDRIDAITKTVADVRTVLTSPVSDSELATLIEGGS